MNLDVRRINWDKSYTNFSAAATKGIIAIFEPPTKTNYVYALTPLLQRPLPVKMDCVVL